MKILPLLFLTLPILVKAVDEVDFNSQIKSLLSNRCIACHGPDEEHREAGLRLDTFEGATRDIDGYSAIVPGNPEESEILFRVTLEDGDQELMPPKGRGERLT
jgi:mono/diheme cytochrome c family protein